MNFFEGVGPGGVGTRQRGPGAEPRWRSGGEAPRSRRQMLISSYDGGHAPMSPLATPLGGHHTWLDPVSIVFMLNLTISQNQRQSLSTQLVWVTFSWPDPPPRPTPWMDPTYVQLCEQVVVTSDAKFHEICWREIFHEIFRETFLKYFKNFTMDYWCRLYSSLQQSK